MRSPAVGLSGHAYGSLVRRLIDGGMRSGYRAAYRMARVWWFFRRPSSRGSNVAIWWGDKVLMVRTSYRPYLCFPGGLIRPGESPVQTAVRELQEETGIEFQPEQLKPVSIVNHLFECRQDEVHLYEVRVAHPAIARIDRREIVWAGYLTAAECLEHPVFPAMRGYLVDRSG